MNALPKPTTRPDNSLFLPQVPDRSPWKGIPVTAKGDLKAMAESMSGGGDMRTS